MRPIPCTTCGRPAPEGARCEPCDATRAENTRLRLGAPSRTTPREVMRAEWLAEACCKGDCEAPDDCPNA
jgi:hypothetical protein